MELRHLRYFVAVAEEQNVTRAARQLRVSQPPLSRQIRDLEDELGIALFNHGAKAVRLTEAGKVFLNEARAVLQRTDQAVKAAKSAAKGERGEIHVGYAPSLTVEILPRALRDFQTANPKVHVQLHDMSTQEMLRALRDEKLNVALVVQVSAKVMSEFVFEELRRYAVCVAVHPAHTLARAREVGLKQLINERLIAFTLADYPEHHVWLADLFAQFSCTPNVAEEHDSAPSLIASVEAGRGVALVLEPFKCFVGPRVKIRPLSPPPTPLAVGIAYRKEANSPATQNFVAAAKLGRSAYETSRQARFRAS